MTRAYPPFPGLQNAHTGPTAPVKGGEWRNALEALYRWGHTPVHLVYIAGARVWLEAGSDA